MLLTTIHLLLVVAIFPFIYLGIALFSAWIFFRCSPEPPALKNFTPPISNLKPVRGLDPDAYQNFASFCRQDYPEYEVVFCIGSTDDPILPVIEKLQRDFPERSIRVLYGSGRTAANDKVAKLARLASEAKYEHLVISDSDVRVRPDYLRNTIAGLADSRVGAVTCLYVSTGDTNLVQNLQSIGMISDFYAGLFVAKQLDGVKFALGPTIATTRTHLEEFGGYETIENRPADDLLVGRLIADRGYEIKLSPYTVETVADYQSMRDLMQKRLRWLVVMRHMRPWGHFGLLFTNALPWIILAISLHPTLAFAAPVVAAYLALRLLLTWMIGVWGLKRNDVLKKLPLVPAWDALAFCIWVISFARNTIKWRGGQYYIRDGILVPASSSSR
ncbi:MAG: glycosyltransferase [Acidobacteriaceae bacterium]|nr:glycosyltransferase [Acidobacteriaceae bacterium]